MRVQKQNGEKNQAKLVGEGFVFLIKHRNCTKKGWKKGRFLSFLYDIVFQLEKKVCSASKGVAFFTRKRNAFSRFFLYFLPFREGLVLKLYTR